MLWPALPGTQGPIFALAHVLPTFLIPSYQIPLTSLHCLQPRCTRPGGMGTTGGSSMATDPQETPNGPDIGDSSFLSLPPMTVHSQQLSLVLA